MTQNVSPRDAGPGDEARIRAGHRDEEGAGGAGQPPQGVDRPGQASLTINSSESLDIKPNIRTQYSRKVLRESTFESTWEERI